MEKYAHSWLLCMLLLLTLSASAQRRGYEPGYIITLEGDTIPGQVKDRAPEPFVALYGRIRFRPEGKSSRKKYSPDDILGYRAGNREYLSLPLREESAFFRFRYYLDPQADHTFLRVVKREGPLTLYEQEFVHDDNNYPDSYPLFSLEGNQEMVRVTQGILGIKRERLAEYFRECPELVRAISDKRLNGVAEIYEYYLARCVGSGPAPRKADRWQGSGRRNWNRPPMLLPIFRICR